MVELEAANRTELRNRLRVWGEHAPDRLARRGCQKELERWVLNRLLRGLDSAGRISYPVSVIADENPDFRVQFGESVLGIEVTEAVDPSEQVRWTEEAREDESGASLSCRGYDLHDETRPKQARCCVERAYNKKLKKCGDGVDALLMYLNTQLAASEQPETVLSWLEDVVPGDSRFRFVWVVDGSRVYELREMTLVATLDRA